MRLAPWHRWVLLGSLAGVGLSGVLWFVLHDVAEVEPRVLLRTLLVVHGVTAYAATIGFGSLLPIHAVVGFQQRRNRRTGLGSVVLIAFLIGSALVLYYGGEGARAWARWLHLGAGLTSIVVVSLHIFSAWRRCSLGPSSV